MQFSLSAPLFLYELRLEKSRIGEILAVIFPVSSLVVQPIVGIASDSCENSLGRRRPLILVGSIGAAFGSFIVAFAIDIGVALGDNPDGAQSSQHLAGILVMIFGLLLMNLMLCV